MTIPLLFGSVVQKCGPETHFCQGSKRSRTRRHHKNMHADSLELQPICRGQLGKLLVKVRARIALVVSTAAAEEEPDCRFSFSLLGRQTSLNTWPSTTSRRMDSGNLHIAIEITRIKMLNRQGGVGKIAREGLSQNSAGRQHGGSGGRTGLPLHR